MDDDLLELAAITNLLLFLQEVQLAREFAQRSDGAAALQQMRAAIDERIRFRARPEPGETLDERSTELQTRMLTRWHRLVENVERRRAGLRTQGLSGQE